METTSLASSAIRATGLAMLSTLALLSAILVVENYSADRSKAAVSAHRAAHVVATQFGWMLEASAHALRRIDDAITREAEPGGAVEGYPAALGVAVRDLPPGLGYSVYDTTGQLVQVSPAAPRLPAISDMQLFRRLKSGEVQMITPMVTLPDGEQVFLLGRRLGGQDGFRGVATVAIPISNLSTLAETLDFTNGSAIGLVALDGTVIARAPPIAPMNIKDSALFDALEQSPQGHFETVSPADGVSRIVGYWQLPDWPLVATAAMDRAAALQGFWRNLGMATILSLPILLGMGWLIYDLLRLMRLDERRQADLARAKERAHFLLREIHHRVKNNLTTVGSLIRLERLPQEVKDRLQGRIGAMVAVHEAMYRSDQFAEIAIRPYLQRLVEDVARGWGGTVDVTLSIPDLRLPGARAMLLGLLVNETVSNAFKHAFAPRGTGKLSVQMERLCDDQLQLVVTDDGPGFVPVDCPGRMGRQLVEAFATQLGGTVSIESAGRTVVTVIFPRVYGSDDMVDDPGRDQPRTAQSGSATGSISKYAMRLSSHGRSSSRT